MKILYVTLHHPDFGMGGAERVLFDLAHSMSGRPSVQVACAVNAGDLANRLKKAGIPVTQIYWPKIQTIQTLLALHRALAEFQPEVVHSHHRFATFLLDLFFKKRAKILHTQHVLRHDRRILFRYGHLATAVHESIRQNLIHHYGVPPDRVVTFPNAVRLPAADAVKLRQWEQKYPRQRGQVKVLCIGRLEEQKGHRYLIEAVNLLPRQDQGRLLIFLAGTGSLESFLRKKVQEAKVESSFVFLGHTDEIPELLALCDFLVLPSLWEGMPLSILEAYSASKPVLVTDIPGSRESVRNGRTGLLVPAGNADALAKGIIKLRDHPDDILTMGREAYAWWKETFSFEKMVESYEQLYQRIRERKGNYGGTD